MHFGTILVAKPVFSGGIIIGDAIFDNGDFPVKRFEYGRNSVGVTNACTLSGLLLEVDQQLRRGRVRTPNVRTIDPPVKNKYDYQKHNKQTSYLRREIGHCCCKKYGQFTD